MKSLKQTPRVIASVVAIAAALGLMLSPAIATSGEPLDEAVAKVRPASSTDRCGGENCTAVTRGLIAVLRSQSPWARWQRAILRRLPPASPTASSSLPASARAALPTLAVAPHLEPACPPTRYST